MDSSRFIHTCKIYTKQDSKSATTKVSQSPIYTLTQAAQACLFVPAGGDESLKSFGEIRSGIYDAFFPVDAKAFVTMSAVLVWEGRVFQVGPVEVYDTFGPKHVEAVVSEIKVVPAGVTV